MRKSGLRQYSPHFASRAALLALLLLAAAPAVSQVAPGHHLPGGPKRPVRDREIDIQRISAELRFDMQAESLAGTITITYAPLHSGLLAISLDAADLAVAKVEEAGTNRALAFFLRDRKLVITLPANMRNRPGAIRITYSAQPTAGMYFFPASEKGSAQAWNYGEGGRHYGWLPLYNDTNDRFAVEFIITVARPYWVLSNGTLRDKKENADGTRTFHWVQEEEIPNYLVTVDVGEFEGVSLGNATVGDRQIPLVVWGPPGEAAGLALDYTFRNTPRMVEFFSERFGYPYPWTKYDQIVLREFSGAMETTSMVGFTETYQRNQGDPVASGPVLHEAYPTWVTEDTIAHELAHHWFGDLVTCRSLGSIWLNESFATFAHTLWTAHDRGEDALTFQRWRYLNRYLDYVRQTGTVRPMEYLQYQSPDDMYQEETTYIKGALVLHMLRHFVGDEGFYKTLAGYLKTHAFGAVESADLLAAFERNTGRDFSWFFNDWITGGGGHPRFAVSYSWSAERKEVDMTIQQTQADLPFENDFKLPVDIEVVTKAGSRTYRVELEGWATRVSFPAQSPPLYVVFDKGNWLVAEVEFSRGLEKVLRQLDAGKLAEQLRAARELATRFPRRKEAVAALVRLLGSPEAHWGLRQEAARGLGVMGGAEASPALVSGLKDTDRRIRRAAALALGHAGGKGAAAALRWVIETDSAEDVVAVAETSLGRLHAAGASAFLQKQLARDSNWWNIIRLGALQGLAELEDPSLVSTFRAYTNPKYERQVRLAALDGWFRIVQDEAELAAALRKLSHDRNANVRSAALVMLGQLHRTDDLRFLQKFASDEPDPGLAVLARDAAAEIEAFATASKPSN